MERMRGLVLCGQNEEEGQKAGFLDSPKSGEC